MNNAGDTRDIDSLVKNLGFRLTESERGQLMAIAIRYALIWGTVVTALWYLLWFSVENDEPAWAGLILFFVVAAVVFHFKRRAMLRRVELIWEETLRRNDLLKLHAKIQDQTNSTT